MLCPIVSAIHLEEQLQEQDQIYIIQVTKGDQPHAVNAVGPESADPGAASLQSLLDSYKDCFPADLPAELPPERNTCHSIPLKMMSHRLCAKLQTQQT